MSAPTLARRVNMAAARHAFNQGCAVIVAEWPVGDTLEVHPTTTVNTRDRMSWDELADLVSVWRNRYPRQTFYVLPYGADDTRRCVCARHTDGSVTTSVCPVHADTDPCLTMSLVTGRRRTGTIRRGVCTSCGHDSRVTDRPSPPSTTVRTMNPGTPREFDRVFLTCPNGHAGTSAPVTSRTGRALLAGDFRGEWCGTGGCGWSVPEVTR